MENNSKNLGTLGEKIACMHLLQKGHEILEVNWRFKKYEVDIISKIGKTIVFSEVKARKSDIFGDPETFVTRQKQNFIISAAQHYITENNIDLESRFDIIAILKKNDWQTVKHLEAAFYPII